jgi:hypothetical protein
MVLLRNQEIFRREQSMKIRIRVISVAVTLALSTALSAHAGDLNGDLVDDAFDNCPDVPNGPNDLNNQVDTDNDGYGNSCDCDFDQDEILTGADFVLLYAAFNSTQELYDINGDGFVLGSDVNFCSHQFGGPPG